MKQSLNYSWKFTPYFKDIFLKRMDEGEMVNIPHSVKEMPYNYFSEEDYQIKSTYEKYFDVEKYDSKRRYFLRFDGFMVKASIYLNEKFLGIHVSAYLPVEIEVTEFIKDKNNRLLVCLDGKEDENIPPFGFALDYLTYSGIYREVYLIDEPQTYLRNIFVRGNLNGDIKVSYDEIGDDIIHLKHHLYKDDKEVFVSEENEFNYSKRELWDLDNPNLYTLKTIIKESGQVYETRFGFREIRFDQSGFYLNNQKIKLVGLNRHQGYPYVGYAASKSLQESDADILKNEIGVNVVRTSHYPQSEHFLNRCDEIGLLNINEIPGWQHLSEKPEWRENVYKFTETMVKSQRNHPSLIAHGVRIDESVDDHELYSKTNEIAHKLDETRPTIGVRNFTGSECLEDIYGFNDFSCDSLNIGLMNPKKVKTSDHPLLVTEYMGHMDPLKATSDQDKKIEVALRHAKVIDDNFKYSNTCGAIGWCFVDYQTHTDFGSGDHICPHGVFDLYRNPKYSSYIYASQQDNFPVMKVLSNMKPGDVKEAIFSDIYVATNCDYIELYKNGELVNKFYPNHEQFKYLKHPPILIDDIVGLTFNEERFPRKIHLKIAKMFSYAAMHGFNHLPLKMKLYLAHCMIRYKMNYSDLVYYWNKYVGAWGGKAMTYTFKGYKNNALVLTSEVGPSNKFDFETKPSKTTLINEDTYDTLMVRIRHVDEHKNVAEYSSRIVKIETNGPIELIGPKEQSLLAGQLTIYVKSKKENGPASILIKVDDLVKKIDLEVKSQ